MTRRRAYKRAQGRHSCDVYWGSHGCRKLSGHIGHHLCSSGCAVPDDGWQLYGDDVLDPMPSVDQRLREDRVGVRA